MARRQLPLVSATDPAAQPALIELDAAMNRFYNSDLIGEYYEGADAYNARWPEESYHQLVKRACRPGMKLIDLGCGSGHAAANLADCGIEYTGVDWNTDRIAANQDESASSARFISSPLYQIDLPDRSFDVSFSFYVLEHLVWPHRFLAEMHRLTKSGGIIIIECPHFRAMERIPSLPYGTSVAPLSKKLRSWRFIDAALHLVQRNLRYPRLLRRRFPRDRFPYLINLKPSCLRGQFYADNDAVYFVDRNEVIDTLVRLGAVDITGPLLLEWGKPLPLDPCVVAVQVHHQA